MSCLMKCPGSDVMTGDTAGISYMLSVRFSLSLAPSIPYNVLEIITAEYFEANNVLSL